MADRAAGLTVFPALVARRMVRRATCRDDRHTGRRGEPPMEGGAAKGYAVTNAPDPRMTRRQRTGK
jgi:hypothetical protein